ncbi:YkgJ family cysteine cluster protein [Neptuniibacter caesariensis]|uniref:Zinc/iron-chelating domain-containing protein n=1 Tax=Neptuniibacter caesariensis TaxID=207954 RepID=A0A7U8CB93_NEPCE|nr:YkgJ family cysteine cluster protein [Neptuniibacter caesariensis]EAR63109.1 hypothetical protein MED92_08316 [Oceanospirillum sp. MED92] [Neptuniibacter caesariensis]
MSEQEVFFSTTDVAEVAEKLRSVTAEYEELFNRLCKQIYVSIETQASASDQVAITLQYVEDALQAFSQNFPDNSHLACGKGCSHCCHFPIETPTQVITDITQYLLDTRSGSELAALKAKLQVNIQQRVPPLNRAPCPFLDEDNACTIYLKRPLSCRWFSSPDARLCEQSVKDGRNIGQHPVQSRIYQAASTALLAEQKKRTGSDQQVAFIPALLTELTKGT